MNVIEQQAFPGGKKDDHQTARRKKKQSLRRNRIEAVRNHKNRFHIQLFRPFHERELQDDAKQGVADWESSQNKYL
ncbi:hypothetical protein [Bacillus sp. JJ675]|uniref:hypothetical protein n=1 Tax=Bacillus sp. JJ675 TaxID=3122972 RepID=UPI002FFEFD3F